MATLIDREIRSNIWAKKEIRRPYQKKQGRGNEQLITRTPNWSFLKRSSKEVISLTIRVVSNESKFRPINGLSPQKLSRTRSVKG
jgi:hypothetical protein